MEKELKTIEKTTCGLCGDELKQIDKPLRTICDFCGKVNLVTHLCESGHYICDICLSMGAKDFIKETCLKYKGKDPMKLAVEIMNSPIIRMHGPEHHFITPAVLLTCVHNAKKSGGNLEEQLDIAAERADTETPRSCEYKIGTCGAAQGAGVFVSIHLGRGPDEEDSWSQSNLIMAEALKKITDHGGPRCCKRDTYLSIEAAVEFLKEKFAIALPLSEAKCSFSHRNKTCGREDCQFYNIGNSLV